MNRAVRFSWVTLALVACRGNTLDIGTGESGGDSSVDGAPGSTNAMDVDGAACPSFANEASDAGTGALAPLAGTWTGYVENYQFPSGSGTIVLSFSGHDGGSVSGTIVFGQGSPPPPPTDPTVGYYPDGVNLSSAPPGTIIEGFPYTVVAPSLAGTRARFGAVAREPYRPWCELQTSYVWMPPCDFACTPSWPADISTPSDRVTLQNPSGGPNLIMNTGRWAQCSGVDGVCDCDPTSCTVRFDAPNVSFDMQMTPGHLDGSVLLGSSANNVHFTSP